MSVPGNLAALKRVVRKSRCEPGAGPCAITCIDVRFNGEAAQVKQVAPRVGEGLAVTSGALVYRDAVCEVIQAVAY